MPAPTTTSPSRSGSRELLAACVCACASRLPASREGAGRARRSRSAPRLAGRRRARPDAEGVRRVARSSSSTRVVLSHVSASCRRSGTSTTTARPARSTCTSRRCAGSSGDDPTSPRPSDGPGCRIPLRDRMTCAGRPLASTLTIVVAILPVRRTARHRARPRRSTATRSRALSERGAPCRP